MSSSKKIGICVGINKYPNPNNNLRGCVNDAKMIKKYLLKYYNFDKVILLLDHHATYQNVITNIQQSMLELSDNGHFVFSVSSHGTTIPDTSGDELDGRDEAICLYDRLLLDDNFRQLLHHAPIGMKATIIADCCHSGSITRSAYIKNFASLKGSSNNSYMKPRYLPFTDDIFARSTRTIPIKNKLFSSHLPEKQMREVLITGCKSNEYSYDAQFNKKYHGALTYSMLQILKNGKNLTYQEFYKLLKTRLPSGHYPQTPQLEGSVQNKNLLMFS